MPDRWLTRASDRTKQLLLKQGQVNRLTHRLVAGISGMKAVASVIPRQDLIRMSRVLHRFIKIDHPIKSVAGANPLVNRLALRFFLQRKIARNGGPAKRGERATKDLNPVLMSALIRNCDQTSRNGEESKSSRHRPTRVSAGGTEVAAMQPLQGRHTEHNVQRIACWQAL